MKGEQIWCLDDETLSNKKGIWKSDSKWTLPEAETSGLVKDTTNSLVLDVSPKEIVTKKDEITDQDIERQKWFRREDFDNGCFVLSNNLRYLTAIDDSGTAKLNVQDSLRQCKYIQENTTFLADFHFCNKTYSKIRPNA